jgi:hypothetical protein
MQSAPQENFASYTPEQWQKYLQDNKTSFERQNQLSALRNEYSWQKYLHDNKTSFEKQNQLSSNQRSGLEGTGAGGNSSSSSSSLFGSVGGIDDYTDRAKDLARFRLGLDQDQATFFRGLREQESQSDFGRTTQLRDVDFQNQFKIGDQQITGQKDLENIRQDATTGRTQMQLDNQRAMQEAGFGQQNLFRAQSAALALRRLR